ncbi:MAG TPA: sigma-70 family RNA polymerase sigma factor [Thermoanaerobaculia bacterium]|jgi:RNA polymerase sigma-70 factor (ECF subfamily)|nr:sigma-70 family RNA polymerase sigma factor [Thermoanaerobaculia bacterium]
MVSFAQIAGGGVTIPDVADPATPAKMLSKLRDRFFRQDSRRARFEQAVLPHLDAAYDLARWLTRNDQDAEDVVQTASLRALQFFDGFQGTNPRAWLLTIVRNSFYSWLQQRNRGHEIADPFDEEIHSEVASETPAPEAELLRRADRRLLRQGFESLPLPYREVMVLRELEGLSYKEIAAIAGILDNLHPVRTSRHCAALSDSPKSSSPLP